MTREQRILNGERTIPSVNSVEKAGYLHIKQTRPETIIIFYLILVKYSQAVQYWFKAKKCKSAVFAEYILYGVCFSEMVFDLTALKVEK